jgi:hypothetical protein
VLATDEEVDGDDGDDGDAAGEPAGWLLPAWVFRR